MQDTDLARRFRVDGYYVRIAPPDTADGPSPLSGFVPIKNRPPGSSSEPAQEIVSPDALALVRFGLRRADDPRILNTLRVIDGLLPEQVWDGPDLPERELWAERPTGSAMPLVWAHAEYLKLARSIHEGAVFDLPPQPAERYRDASAASTRRVWRFNHKLRSVPAGTRLRVECREPAVVHWSSDAWRCVTDAATRDGGCGMHYVDLPTGELAPGSGVVFTFRWASPERWEGTNYAVAIGEGP